MQRFVNRITSFSKNFCSSTIRLHRQKRINHASYSNRPLLAASFRPSLMGSGHHYIRCKRLTQLSGIALLSIPAHSILLDDSTHDGSDKHAQTQAMPVETLTVASVKNDSTFFSTDGFEHGFGYDITRAYAQSLGLDIKLKDYASSDAALKAVTAGEADMALTTTSLKAAVDAGVSTLTLSCGQDDILRDNGLHQKVSWGFKNGADALAVTASHFVCGDQQLQQTAKVAAFYDQTLLEDDYNKTHFEKTLNNRLPNYQSSFQQQAQNYDHDWELLVAMGYQESHLDANAVSPTGVQGLMMLTRATAKEMGVANRVDPYQSIGGGARYLEQMKAQFADVPNPDRLWFALASYNMGPNAVKRIQRKLEEQGIDGNRWANVYVYMSDNRSKNSRYGQCIHYVTNIRSYLESLKTRAT